MTFFGKFNLINSGFDFEDYDRAAEKITFWVDDGILQSNFKDSDV